MSFSDKLTQAATLVTRVVRVLSRAPVLVVTDNWLGSNSLFKPLRAQLGVRAHLLSRLRVNAALYDDPIAARGEPGRPRKNGRRLGNAADLAAMLRAGAVAYTLHVCGAVREVLAAHRVVLLKTLRCPVRVVWMDRRSQWIALMTTDLDLTVAQIVEYYSTRGKIEAGLRETKQEIGTAPAQTCNPDSVANYLNFCMVARTVVWLYAAKTETPPSRRYHSDNTTEFAFADARRALSHEFAKTGFGIDCADSVNPPRNPLIAVVISLAA